MTQFKMKQKNMRKRMGRPLLFNQPMVDRTFRITVDQDISLTNLANENKMSKNAMIRKLIKNN